MNILGNNASKLNEVIFENRNKNYGAYELRKHTKGEEFNNEVVRVLKKMPPWIPGKTKGENVSVYYSIP